MKKFLTILQEKPDFASGLFIAVFALVLFALIPQQVPDAKATYGVKMALPAGHKFFPIIALGFMLIPSLYVLYVGFITKTIAKAKKSEDFIGFWVSILAWALYAVLVIYIGYAVSTVIMLLFLMKYYGVDNWRHIILITVGVSIFVYIIFVKVMMLPFPKEALFF